MIKQKTWQPWIILVFDWLTIKESSPETTSPNSKDLSVGENNVCDVIMLDRYVNLKAIESDQISG